MRFVAKDVAPFSDRAHRGRLSSQWHLFLTFLALGLYDPPIRPVFANVRGFHNQRAMHAWLSRSKVESSEMRCSSASLCISSMRFGVLSDGYDFPQGMLYVPEALHAGRITAQVSALVVPTTSPSSSYWRSEVAACGAVPIPC